MHDTIHVQTTVTFPDGRTHTAAIRVEPTPDHDLDRPLPRDREIFPEDMRDAIEQAANRRAIGQSIASAITGHIMEAVEAQDTVNGYTQQENAEGGRHSPRLRSLPSHCEVGDYVPESAFPRARHDATHHQARIRVMRDPMTPIGPETTVPIGIFRRHIAGGQRVWVRQA